MGHLATKLARRAAETSIAADLGSRRPLNEQRCAHNLA